MEGGGANRSLELVVDLRGAVLAGGMVIEAAVRPCARLHCGQLRGSWLSLLTVGGHASQLGDPATLPCLVIGLRIDLADVLQVLLELKLGLVESLCEGVRLLLQVIEAIGPLWRCRRAA